MFITGTVKFVGVVDDSSIAPQLYVGVKLDDNGKCNSIVIAEIRL